MLGLLVGFVDGSRRLCICVCIYVYDTDVVGVCAVIRLSVVAGLKCLVVFLQVLRRFSVTLMTVGF